MKIGLSNLKPLEMESNTRFMAKELPEDEMKMLYSLLGKGTEPTKNSNRKFRLWNWRRYVTQ